MTYFTADKADAERIAREVGSELDEAMRGAAVLSEFTVDLPGGLEARRPLSESQREVAVALNTLARLFEQRAEEACAARDARWEGLADAGTMTRNAAGQLGLPQLPSR